MHILFGTNQYETPGLAMSNLTWQDLIDLCDDARTITRPIEDKWKSGWVSPAILYSGSRHRQLTDVEKMSNWVGLDGDHANWTISQIKAALHGLSFIAYSTTRSTVTERRWRLFVPVSRAMTPAEFSGVWKAYNTLLDGEIDNKTRNVNRLHYLPARWIGGNNEYHVQDGEVLNVDGLLEFCPPEEPDCYVNTVFHTDGVQRPDGTQIITEAMISRHMGGQAGGRFFRLMAAAATMHKAKGWHLSASELANAALSISPKDSSGVNRATSALREAERALSYINDRVQKTAPQDVIMERMKWKWKKHEVRT